MKNFFLILLYAIGFLPQGVSQVIEAENEMEIGIDEKLDSYIPKNKWIINHFGDTIFLDSIIDKPTILNFVYYRCPGICSPLMNGIAEVVKKSDMKLGEDYQILTISFDTREGYELANQKRNNYLSQLKNKNAENGWFFFTGDSANIISLTNATGFKYKQTGNDFVHAAAIIVVSPDNKITRYLYGLSFLPFELKMAIVEASKGKSSPTINKILQFCYSYDPQGQEYVLNITRISGVFIMFFLFLVFLYLILKPVIKKSKKV